MKRISSSTALKVELTTQDTSIRILRCYPCLLILDLDELYLRNINEM